jgi:hypothetical protein
MILLPIATAVLFYGIYIGWATLNPYAFEWLLKGDSAIHFLGWSFFRNSPWEFPLGNYNAQMAPFGSNIINADGVPLVAILLKSLLGAGKPIQFTGCWLISCYTLQAFFSFKLLELKTKNAIYSWIGSIFFLTAPILLFRFDHKALCAQWMILACFYLYFRAMQNRQSPYAGLFLINVLTVGVHFYFLPMIFGLTVGAIASLHFYDAKKYSSKNAASFLVGTIACAFSLMWMLGYFQLDKPTSTGFSIFSADLLTFLNSRDNSLFLKHIRSSSSQREGFGYLGLGAILLLFFTLWKIFRVGSSAETTYLPRHRWFLLVIGLFFAFALSSNISIGGNTFLKIEGFYKILSPLPEILRSSGRFIWPLYYLLFLALVVFPYRLLQKRNAYILLCTCLVIQLVDSLPYYRYMASPNGEHAMNTSGIRDTFWTNLKVAGFKQMNLVPPAPFKDLDSCDPNYFRASTIYSLSYSALINGMQINSALLARPSDKKIAESYENLWTQFAQKNQVGQIYIFNLKSGCKSKAASIVSDNAATFRCREIDGLEACSIEAAVN